MENTGLRPCVLGGNLGGGLFQPGFIYMKVKLHRNFLLLFIISRRASACLGRRLLQA
ncbi:hypothetical protein OH686_05485 [Pseudomonas sp. SO81]|nr:hypothetical protein OH686_05485 [Pseudomonas sp. SO81]